MVRVAGLSCTRPRPPCLPSLSRPSHSCPLLSSYVRYSANGRYLLTSSLDSHHRLMRPLQEADSADPSSISSVSGNMSTIAAKSTFRCATGVFSELKTYSGHDRQVYSSPTQFARISLPDSPEPRQDDHMELQEPGEEMQRSLRDVVIGGSDDGKVSSSACVCSHRPPPPPLRSTSGTLTRRRSSVRSLTRARR
jgi:hypothetical protein